MRRVSIFAAACLASGAMFCLALPPSNLWFLGWVAFVPLLVAVRGQGFLIGFGGGLLSLFTTAYLVQSGVFYFEKAFVGSDAWIFTGCGLFGFTVSILAGVWADKGSTAKPLWWFATLAVCLESLLLFQLPAHLALTQYQHPLMLFIASVGGIWLATFLVWMFNIGLAGWIKAPDRGKPRIWLTLAIPIVAGNFMRAIFAVYEVENIQVGIVQTEASDKETLLKLQAEAVAKGADVVVWPEFAGLALAPSGNTKEIKAVAKESGSAIVTSFRDDYSPLPHNAAALVTATVSSPFYFKQKLFGGETNMHTPGNQAIAAAFRDGSVGLNICFDSCYPSIIRATSKLAGVDFIALPTIDPESPHHFISAVHAAFTPFRAAENGVSIIRADGYSNSMAVLSSGQIAAWLPAGERTASVRISPPRTTVYRHLGDWFLYLCWAAVIYGALAYRKGKPGVDPEEERLKAFAEEVLGEVKGKE